MSNPFRYFNSSPEIIRLTVLMYVKYPLSLRNVEDLLAERGIDVSHETVRFWWNRFGPMFAAEIRKRRAAHMRGFPQWRWHLDEAFVKVNGKLCYLWRAVDHEGEVLEAVVTAKRDRTAALKFLKRLMKRYGQPQAVVTDGFLRIALRCRRSVGSTIGRRIRISRFDGENGRCKAFEARRPCKSSARFMARFTTISIRSVISSAAKNSNRGAWPHSPNGAPWRHKRR